MGYLSVENDKRIYFEHHAGDGRAIVLVHGWGANTRCWDTIAPALRAAGHEVVLVDLRASGKSDKDFDDVSIKTLGADVAALSEHLNLKSPIINGWSLGGGVATEAVAALGSKAGGLVLTGGASPRYTATDGWPHGSTVADVEEVLAGAAANRADTFRAVAGAVFATAPSDDTLNWIWAMFMEMGPRGDDSLRDLATIDLRKELTALEVPILVLHGRDDGFVPFSNAKAIPSLNAGARIVEFANCGHAPFLEHRDQYLSELTGFLSA